VVVAVKGLEFGGEKGVDKLFDGVSECCYGTVCHRTKGQALTDQQ